MERLRSERATSVDMGPSNAQPLARTAAATTSAARRHSPSGWVGRRFTRRDGSAWPGRPQDGGRPFEMGAPRWPPNPPKTFGPPRQSRGGPLFSSAGECKQRVQEDVGAALDGGGGAGLVHAVALAALRGDEEHAGVGDERQG